MLPDMQYCRYKNNCFSWVIFPLNSMEKNIQEKQLFQYLLHIWQHGALIWGGLCINTAKMSTWWNQNGQRWPLLKSDSVHFNHHCLYVLKISNCAVHRLIINNVSLSETLWRALWKQTSEQTLFYNISVIHNSVWDMNYVANSISIGLSLWVFVLRKNKILSVFFSHMEAHTLH